MTAHEKSDLFAILDKGSVPLEASARAFLEAVVGRAPPPLGGTVDLIKDPELHKDERTAEGKPKFEKKRFAGPLVKSSLSPRDVEQGSLGNCYFAAAMSAIAEQYPEKLAKAMEDNKDGTFTFNFKERDWATGRLRNVKVKVDGDLYVKVSGTPLYGRSAGDKTPQKMELWFPLFEKAYAQYKGSYHAIGEGGWASEVFQDVLGFEPATQNINESAAGQQRAWKTVTQAVDNKWPLCACTFGEKQEPRYTNSGVFANHAYTVLGYEEKNGKRYVKLRNPWGSDEPSGNGKDDGIFAMELSKFVHLYESFEIGKP